MEMRTQFALSISKIIQNRSDSEVINREKIGLTGHDVGEGWLIFDLPEVDLGRQLQL